MAITAKFTADFQSFYDAVKTAEAHLTDFQSGAGRVEKSLNRMVDNFSGRKVIQEATLAAEAIERIGGVSNLTANELADVSAKAEEAVKKLRTMGADAPKNLQDLAAAGNRVTNSLGQTAGALRQVDGALNLVGVHVGPLRQAVDDLDQSFEQAAAGSLSNFAKAGLVVGTLIASFKATRAVGEFLGVDWDHVDKQIGDVTAKLLGFGDAAAETAAAKADVLTRASKAMGFAINDVSTAMIINEDAAKKAIAANIEYSNSIERMKAPAKAAADLAKWNAELAELKSAGLLRSLTADINSHAFSVQTLAERYLVSTDAIGLFSKEAENAGRIEENNAKKLADLRDALTKSAAEADERARLKAEAATQALHEQTQAAWKDVEAQAALRDAATAAQEDQKRKVEETNAALRKQQDEARKAAEQMVFLRTYDLSTKAGMAEFRKLNPGATISGAANSPEYFQTHTLADAIREGFINLYGKWMSDLGSRGVTGGATNLPPALVAGLVVEGGTGLPVLGPGEATIPLGRGAGTTTLNVTLQTNGLVDPTAAKQMANVVGDEILKRISVLGKVA
jgi:hypothetical protein